MLARLGRAFLIAAVLLAQQTALAHDFWHAGTPQGVENPNSPSSKGNKLCDLHDLLGTVLGVLSAGSLVAPFVQAFDAQPLFVVQVAAETAPLAPHSRGPPLIS